MVYPNVWDTDWSRKKDKLENGDTYQWDFDATYYAKWRAIPCTVAWEANGGSEVRPRTYTTFYDYPLGRVVDHDSLPETTRTGYDFVGWFTRADEFGA